MISHGACRTVGVAVALGGLAVSAHATAGPGVGSLTFDETELHQPVAWFDDQNGADGGTNVPLLVGGYLLLHVAPDSGNPGRSLSIYDVSDPRNPVLAASHQDEHTATLRETHSLPVARIAGREYVAFQAVDGIQIWDFTDPLAPAFSGGLALEGVAGGDYFNAAWMTSWQGRYLFVGGTSLGLFVVDVADPSAPTLVTKLEQSETGGFLVGPIYAMGDRLAISSMSLLFAHFSILDISDPAEPFLVNTFQGPGGQLYSSTVLGKRFYGVGRNTHFTIISFESDDFEVKADLRFLGDASYASVQDDFVHYGGRQKYQKIDISDETSPQVVSEIVLERTDVDHGQAFAFGNLVYIGNDHGTGSALAVHQLEPDTTPPRIVQFFPDDETTGLAKTSRLGISFSDNLDFRSVGPESIEVRTVDGAVVDGIYSYWSNTVSFGPNEPFADDTVYEVVVKAGGVRDVVGNAVDEESTMRFTTGTSFPNEGGAGGQGGIGEGGAAGSPAGGNGGTAPATDSSETDDDAGCGCRSAGARRGSGSWLAALAGVALLARRRRRRR